jgi:hypothetical protein
MHNGLLGVFKESTYFDLKKAIISAFFEILEGILIPRAAARALSSGIVRPS